MHTSTPDLVPPETTITSAPPAVTAEAVPAIAFTSDDPTATFACSVDGDDAQPCASPFGVALGEGPHTIAVAATDAAGNIDPTPAVASFTVDRSAPETSVAGPPAFTAADAPAVAFSADQDGASFTCSLDGAAEAPCTSPFATPLPEGPHSVAVRGHRPGRQRRPDARRGELHRRPHGPRARPAGRHHRLGHSVYGATVTYDASAADGADPAPTVSCAPASGANFPVGTNTVNCNAVDAAGNGATGAFLVDRAGRPGPGRAVAGLGSDQPAHRGPRAGRRHRRGRRRRADGSPRQPRDTRLDAFGRGAAAPALLTSIQLRSLRYDDDAPIGLSRTLYSARGTLGTDGKLRRAVLVAAVARRAVVVLYTVERGRGTSRIMWLRSAARPRFETRSGLWVPSLVTSAGGASVDLVAGRASGGGAVSAPGHDADALGDVLERLVVVNADLTALERHDPLGA